MAVVRSAGGNERSRTRRAPPLDGTSLVGHQRRRKARQSAREVAISRVLAAFESVVCVRVEAVSHMRYVTCV